MLPEVGADLEVSQGTTGQAVTVCALGVLLGYAAGWRGSFAVLTALTLAAVAMLALIRPRPQGPAGQGTAWVRTQRP